MNPPLNNLSNVFVGVINVMRGGSASSSRLRFLLSFSMAVWAQREKERLNVEVGQTFKGVRKRKWRPLAEATLPRPTHPNNLSTMAGGVGMWIVSSGRCDAEGLLAGGFHPHLPGMRYTMLAKGLGATMWFFIFYRAR